jgi:small GTP-binding protein
MDPEEIFEVGRVVARTVKTAGGLALAGGRAIFAGGTLVHNWLKTSFPAEDPAARIEGESDFPPLKIKVSENLGYNINLIKTAAQKLKSSGLNSGAAAINSIIDQINDDSFTVLFIGRFNTGKSTLLNKLLGKNILKIGNGETTKTLAWLMYAEDGNEAAWYHDSQDDMYRIPLEAVVAIPDEPPVFNIFAGVHADILNRGAVFIDTPGLEASDKATALTMEAVDNADAVILVVDHYPVKAGEQELIQKLRHEGRAEKLFVVMNKMDQVQNPDERQGLIRARMKVFAESGVSTRVFPLSCTDETAVDGGFNNFRKALEDYIGTNLQDARDSAVSQRVKNTAVHLRKMCEDAAEYSRLNDDQRRQKEIQKAQALIRNADQEMRTMINHNQDEIRRLKNSTLNDWKEMSGRLKDEVNNTIRNATDEQLNNPNQLLGNIQEEIDTYLSDKLQEAKDQIEESIARKLNDTLPMPEQEGNITLSGLARWNKNFDIPPAFGSLGLMALTFVTKAHGLFSTIACLPSLYLIHVLSPLIDSVFKKTMDATGTIAMGVYRTQLQKQIDSQWCLVDDRVQEKIRKYFTKLLDLMDCLAREEFSLVISKAQDMIAKAKNCTTADQAEKFEGLARQLGTIVH